MKKREKAKVLLYLIGSLRNPEIPRIANKIRESGLEVFDDWYAAGPEADDYWREYEIGRGRSYKEALQGAAAKNVFQFDKTNLKRAQAVVLVLPAGKSGHLELGWSLGIGKKGYILLDSPDRWDVMYQFADVVTDNLEEIISHAKSVEQTPQELPTQLSLRWEADEVGESVPTRPEEEGEGSGGGSRKVSELAPFSTEPNERGQRVIKREGYSVLVRS